MSDRRRINISVSETTYNELKRVAHAYGFANLCEVVSALVSLFLDRMTGRNHLRNIIPEDDHEYIAGLFDELTNAEPQPDGTVPVRHPNKTRE